MANKNEPFDWFVATEHALRKVFREKSGFVPCGAAGDRASVSAARNEYKNLQLVISPPDRKNLKAVRVEASDLIHQETGDVIPADQIELFRVGYVQTRKCLYPVEHVGWWPDPLLPMAPFDVKTDEVQPVWVTVHVPADAAAGVYRGKIRVTPSNASPRDIDLEVRVRDFALSGKPPLTMAFGFGVQDQMSAFYKYYPPEKFDSQEMVNKTIDLLARYGVNNLLYGYVTCRDDHLLKIDKSGDKWRYDFSGLEGVLGHLVEKGFTFNIFSPSFWSEPALNFVLTPLLAEFAYLGKEIFTSAEFERRVREILESYVAYLEEKGWLDHAFCYVWDEPQSRPSLDHCERMNDMVKEVCSSMRRFLACGYATPEDVEGIDIWSPHLGEYLRDEDQYRAAKEAGEEIWWYVSNSPNHPYPTLFVDFPAIAHRIIWWMTWKYGLGGFVYWNVSAWNYAGTENFHEDPQKRWPNVPWKTTMFADADGNARKGTANGAGQLIYPWPDGPIPSLRLAVIRDGLQDYEYLRLLRERIDQLKLKTGGKELTDLIAESEEALKVVDVLIRSTSDYEKDPARLLAARETIAAQIEKTLFVG